MNTKKILASLIALTAIPGAQASPVIEPITPLEVIAGFLLFRPYTFIIATIGGLAYLFAVLGFKDHKWQKRIGLVIGTILSEIIILGVYGFTAFLFGDLGILVGLVLSSAVVFLVFICLIRSLLQIVGGTKHKWKTATIFGLITFAIVVVAILAIPV